MSATANWSYPTNVCFGAGRIRELAEACRSIGLAKPLLVTDPGLSRLRMVTDAVAFCRAAGLDVAVFDEVQAIPSTAMSLKASRDTAKADMTASSPLAAARPSIAAR